ncbi:MAG: hypothetical protein QOH72_5521, partial [Solirubrobacteraceae bacterium]|nr:hypothetical protein [Solirubrobacteraceae bacterium]
MGASLGPLGAGLGRYRAGPSGTRQSTIALLSGTNRRCRAKSWDARPRFESPWRYSEDPANGGVFVVQGPSPRPAADPPEDEDEDREGHVEAVVRER